MGSTITASFLGFTSLLIDCRRRLLSSFGILERVSKTPPERNPEAGKVEERRVARSAFLRPRVSFDVSLRRHVVLQSQNPGCQSPPFPNPVTRVAVRSYLLTSPAPPDDTGARIPGLCSNANLDKGGMLQHSPSTQALPHPGCAK